MTNITSYKRKIASLKKELAQEREGTTPYNRIKRKILTNRNCILKLKGQKGKNK